MKPATRLLFYLRKWSYEKIGSSKALIPLISVIFILLAGMAMTGCATTTARTPLMKAVEDGDSNTIRALLDKGADVNEVIYPRNKHIHPQITVSGQGWTPLMMAAVNGRTEIAKLLIEKGADIEGIGFGWTPLEMAAINGRTEIAKLLIEKGADVDKAIATLKDFLVRHSQTSNPDPDTSFGKGIALLNRIKVEVAKAAQKKEKEQEIAKPNAATGNQILAVKKSDVDELPAVKAKINKNSYAIVIGIEQYRQKLPKADYAVADAKTMTEYLTKVMGYPEENVVTLTNDRASLTDFAKYFEKWLPNNVEKDSSVFIYYSGHGAPNVKTGDAFLVPYDGDPSFIAETGYSLKRMYAALGKLPAKEIVVALDSCFSGAGGRSVIAKGARPLVMNLQGSVALSRNITVLSASSGEQISSTYDEKGHGLFTYFLLKGIKDEDVVKPDGSIKMDELFGYIKPQVERIARKQYNNEQTPQLIGAK